MKGTYRIKQDGVIIARADNLLTEAAARAFLRYLAGQNQSWAGAIAVGVSSTTPEATNRHLGFEFGRGAVDVRTPSFLDNSITVKATIPDNIEGHIHELGLYSLSMGNDHGGDQLMITDFNPDLIDATSVTSTESRIGRAASSVETIGTNTTTAEFRNMLFNIGVLGPEDRLVLAYESDSVGSVEVRLLNSPNDYLYYSFTAEPGYNVQEIRTTDLSTQGNGSILNTFTGIDVLTTGVGTEGYLILDGLRADDTDVFEEQVLVSRAVLTEPIQKSIETDLEIEYTIEFGF